LRLYNNQLSSLPPEIGQLASLRVLEVSVNHLTTLPPEIGQLGALQFLGLSKNELTNLPSEIPQLNNLCALYLEDNNLHHLPTTVGKLTLLAQVEPCANSYQGLYLKGNPLTSPPPEVVEQGTAAVLAYLRNQAWYHVQRLIIAGASGVGLLAILVLGVRWKQRGGRKPKQKREPQS
jgi:internalin A